MLNIYQKILVLYAVLFQLGKPKRLRTVTIIRHIAEGYWRDERRIRHQVQFSINILVIISKTFIQQILVNTRDRRFRKIKHFFSAVFFFFMSMFFLLLLFHLFYYLTLCIHKRKRIRSIKRRFVEINCFIVTFLRILVTSNLVKTESIIIKFLRPIFEALHYGAIHMEAREPVVEFRIHTHAL